MEVFGPVTLRKLVGGEPEAEDDLDGGEMGGTGPAASICSAGGAMASLPWH